MDRKFGLHGEYSLKIQEQTLLIRAKGPGNLELVEQYVKDVENQIKWLSENGAWATLVVLSGTPLLPPDASKLLKRTISQEKYQGLTASAVVLEGVEYSQSISRFWLDIYKNAGIKAALFDDECLAMEWLNEQLYKPDI